jgi:nucleoside-diphosphate-sugar epimerase
MRILITGADRPFGRLAAEHLAGAHDLRLTGTGAGEGEPGYRRADLRDEAAVRELVAGMQAVVHAAELDPEPLADEIETLHRASYGTYVLCEQARKAVVERIVIASTLALFDACPPDWVIDEMWKPRPQPRQEHLAPFLCEKVAREFVREGGLCGIALRFLPIGRDHAAHTTADALSALDKALAVPFAPVGYRWHVLHIADTPRFLVRDARNYLGWAPREAG